MKKLLFIILLLLPFTVRAVANVEVTGVEKVDQSDTVIINSEPTFEGIKVSFDFKFTKVGDFVKYKVAIKNNATKDYEVDIGSVYSEGEYIEYAFGLIENDTEVLKAGETKDIYLTIKYNKQVPLSAYKDGAYVEQNVMTINLSNDDAIHASVDPATQKKEDNPDTGAKNVLIFLAILAVSAAIMTIAIKKNNTMILPLLILLIPITIHALEKITIEVDAKIEIENIYEQIAIKYCYSGENAMSGTLEVYYERGMTLEEFLNSEYSANVPDRIKTSLTPEEGYEYSVRYYDNEYDACITENGFGSEACAAHYATYDNMQFTLKPKTVGYYDVSACK